MRIKLKVPLTANFVQTNKGTFAIHELNEDEFEEYKTLIISELNKKWCKK